VSIEKAKESLRREIWAKLESERIARFPLPCSGRIPNFVGSESAARTVRLLDEWKRAKVVFAGPDFAQQKVREFALLDGKTLVMASPKLKHGCVVVEPKDARGSERFASTIRGAFELGKTVGMQRAPKPDLIVEGSVAVDTGGHRLGKGGGYGDVEIRALKGFYDSIPVLTTVHDVQVVVAVPYGEDNERVSLIVTPTTVIRVVA
jgi:5-formyltetrahydrofolate cyclo-ligase